MSPDLERLLRESREALPVPDEDASERARRRTLSTLRTRRTRPRALFLAGATVVTAVILGVTAGSLNAPSVTAAQEPPLLGFVPESGWFALQAAPRATAGQQTTAVAANIPFAADDVVSGFVEPSGLPYSTLLTLPPGGIVIVLNMTPESELHYAPIPTNPEYPERVLPLRLRDAVPLTRWGAQVRPDQPTAQYQLRAKLVGQHVDVYVYFGVVRPSQAQLQEAQRQLSGLVVRERDGAAASSASSSSQHKEVVLDRSYACSSVLLGGVYELESKAHAGWPGDAEWSKLPYAVVATGGWAGPAYPVAPRNSLAWISAGAPSSSTTVGMGDERFPPTAGGTLGVNTTLCKPSLASVPLASPAEAGTHAPPEQFGFECVAPRQLFLRIRATLDEAAVLGKRARYFRATDAPVRDAELVVRAPSGALLTHASVERFGDARLYAAKECTPR